MNTISTNDVFDGPFRVPHPRKQNYDCEDTHELKRKIKKPTPTYKKIEKCHQSLIFQKLLLKLIQCPNTLSKYEMKVLSTHPIINKLLKASKTNTYSNASFYVPIDSLINPELYKNEELTILWEKSQQNTDQDLQQSKPFVRSDLDDAMSDESTSSSHDCEDTKIGHYTTKERQLKINKYKMKVRKSTKIDACQNINKREKKQAYKQSLTKRRFSKYSQHDDDFLSLIDDNKKSSSNTNPVNTYSNNCRQSEFSEKGEKNLNDIVAEITGIF